MEDLIETGTISSRGQICIPNNIRERMNLKEGTRVVFMLNDDKLVLRKAKDFAEITRPLKEAMAKTGMKESEVVDLIHKFRKEKNEGNIRH
jgi:AbrB family looped-hinge helix DNA binding protein